MMRTCRRDRRFYELKKKDPHALTSEEIRELIAYCDSMIDGRISKKARKSWFAYRSDLLAILKMNQ